MFFFLFCLVCIYRDKHIDTRYRYISLMGGSNTNLVTTVIGFGLSATFIVFVCTRIICGRLQRHVASSRTIYEFDSRADIEGAISYPEHHVNGPGTAILAAIPTLKFNQEAFSSIEYTQCVICLSDYKDQELLRIIPKCGHSFHLSCIDMWLRKQSTCPVCRLPLQNALQTTKHNVTTTVAFTINHSLGNDGSNSSERNNTVVEERQDYESNSSNNPLQPSSGEPPAIRQ